MLKAIETVYKGYRFRSRLEARWAVFFDALGLEWEYEKEGYDLGDEGLYLPDFYLPSIDRWIEIKPPMQNGDWPEHRAWASVDHDPKHPEFASKLIVLCGSPWPNLGDDSFAYEGFIWNDNQYLWTECPICGKIGIQYGGRAGRLCACIDSDKVYNTKSDKLMTAYSKAQKARFEHGETP